MSPYQFLFVCLLTHLLKRWPHQSDHAMFITLHKDLFTKLR